MTYRIFIRNARKFRKGDRRGALVPTSYVFATAAEANAWIDEGLRSGKLSKLFFYSAFPA